MSENQNTPPSESDKDAELQREIRADRKFSLAEAIGRMAGPGMMKGASPVPPQQQAEGAIADFLNCHLTDAGGVLAGVLLRGVMQSDLLLDNFDRPLAALAAYLQRVLGSDYLVKEIVRQADVEWGQEYGERPHFERPGEPPDPNDPYTHVSVRAALTQLVEKLAAGAA
jgi:hypothetical protein